MSKVITVIVTDKYGFGLYGQRVKEYGGEEERTDGDGRATLVLSGSRTTIYVNGRERYNGSVSALGKELIVEK